MKNEHVTALVLKAAFRVHVVVEVKAVRQLMEIDHAQLLSHLRLKKMQTGLLINFHVPRLRVGIKRIAN